MNQIRLVPVVILASLALVIAFIWMWAALLFNSRSRALKIAVGADQTANAAFGGDEDETISSRCWREREKQPYTFLQVFVDKIFALSGDTDHCKRSYETEVTKKQSWNK